MTYYGLEAQINHSLLKSVEIFPDDNTEKLKNINDGIIDSNIWESKRKNSNYSFVINFSADFVIGGSHIYLPVNKSVDFEKVSFQYYEKGEWSNFEGGTAFLKSSNLLSIVFSKTASTSKIKINFTNASNLAISEITVWGTKVPDLWYGVSKGNEKFIPKRHWVCVNQVAHNINAPKRFTVPTANADLVYYVVEKESDKVLFKGTLKNKIGDFTKFKPKTNSFSKEYFIRVKDSIFGDSDSYPFLVAEEAIQKTAYQSAVDFMNDARSMVGTHPSAYGGCPWRDGAYYTFEVPSMVMMYLSNPEVFEKMKVSINYNKEKEKILSSSFNPTKEPSDKKALSIIQSYYSELENPKDLKAPDIIQMIRFGIGWYLLDPNTKDPSGDELGWQIHNQTVEQFAFFLYGYPAYQKYISHSFYNKVLQKTLKLWDETGLFKVITKIGTPKGRHCLGHSILPNLLMYEVAKRENLSTANLFLEAAYNQTKWVIENVDWKDPKYTKGQRISEPRLITGLSHFQKNYPEFAPKGLLKKINAWSKEVIRLSENEWDFRRYDLNKNWTLPSFNEAGNVIGFPACALSVAMVTKDKQIKDRLVQIAYAHIDNFNGRNPTKDHCANNPEKGFIGVDSGWKYGDPRHDVCARLETVRGALCSLPGTEMYPFNPLGKPRHGEGWTVYNSNWNLTLAYLNFYEGISSIEILKKIPNN
ncbi:hypothetical protein [Polaribacter porphyrae]|nr:hypothetical protein [Polaribacter porphyrae]